jgi:hypothetical protein
MPYSGQNYEFLFTAPWGELKESAFETVRNKNVFRYRAKTIKSGDVLEIEIYPLWNTQNEIRAAKANTTPEAQHNLNERNTKKALIRKINTNFTEADLHVTLTYKRGYLPDEQQARRDMRNFIRRVRNYHKKNSLPELKYVYVIEFSKRKMLLGMAHDRLVYLCMQFIDRGDGGWLTKEEYENAYKYLYLPYKKLGGNGTIDRLMEEVKKLPIKPSLYYKSSGSG